MYALSRANFCNALCLACIVFPVNSPSSNYKKKALVFQWCEYLFCCISNFDDDLVMNCIIRSSEIFIPQYLWPFED
jgi:hypothetical protein